MQDTNIHTGVYEQIINRLFKLKLNKVDTERFYIGKKPISKDDAMSILSKYLQNLIEIAFANTPDDQDADKYTDFINSVIKALGKEFNMNDTELDLIDAQKTMTAYKDYAQNREFFHWETQNRVREGSREAEAYRNGGNNMLLFVRQQVEHPDYGCRMGFTYLGQVTMKSMEGSKPMQIVWHLTTPMSEATYAFASQYKAIG